METKAFYYSSCSDMIEDSGVTLGIPISMISSSVMRLFINMVNKDVTAKYSRCSQVSYYQIRSIVTHFCTLL